MSNGFQKMLLHPSDLNTEIFEILQHLHTVKLVGVEIIPDNVSHKHYPPLMLGLVVEHGEKEVVGAGLSGHSRQKIFIRCLYGAVRHRLTHNLLYGIGPHINYSHLLGEKPVKPKVDPIMMNFRDIGELRPDKRDHRFLCPLGAVYGLRNKRCD